tara:strand:+ start:260 stop:679 length:420 start_codon:yes stop_codon:yes gene_type:complete
MIPAQNGKFLGYKFSSNSASHDHEFDTLGGRYLVIQIAANGGSGAAFSEQPNLSESDTSGSGHSAITGAALSGLTSPSSAAADSGSGVFYVDLRGKKRFIRIDYSAGESANVAVIGHLVRNTEAPVTAATSDYASRVVV